MFTAPAIFVRSSSAFTSSASNAAGAHAKAQGWIYAGYKMTIFSTAEEQQREPLEIGGKVLFYRTSPCVLQAVT
jgi:Tfp pilus tip-associated adhesin PilY1